jgi:outer membrane protein OmpA-like peptidoglycan-associated protein
VKAALVAGFGIASDRITTKGLGDTKPAAPNTTAVGRALNRRVAVVKQ